MAEKSAERPRLRVALPLIAVFLTSMGVMIVELAASRLVSKYFGTSLYTWTSVIGVVLGGIAAGNWIGGRLSDRYSPLGLAALLLLIASAAVFLILPLDLLLGSILHGVGASTVTGGLVARSVLAIVFLFFVPCAALGAISPAVAKLVLERTSRLGNAVGTVYALGSLGSIVGTFLSGFVLIPMLGVRAIVLVVGAIVGLLSLAMARRKLPAAIWLLLMTVLYLLLGRGVARAGTLTSAYSAYSYIEVRDQSTDSGRSERVLIMDGLIHNRYDPARPDDLLYE